MKGLSKSESASDSHEMLRKLQMTEKTNTLARDLSGGQKRKLCLGISLVGRAKVNTFSVRVEIVINCLIIL